jgi:internalin A
MDRQELVRMIDRAADEGCKELDLAGLGIEELPKEIGKCQQLEKLDLGRWDGQQSR